MKRIEALRNQFKTDDLKLTFDTGVLTRAEREAYEENGYHVVKGMFSDEDIRKWIERFKEYADGKLEKLYGMQVVRDISLVKKGGGQALGEAAITKIQDWQEDDILMSFCTHAKMYPYIKTFCGENIKQTSPF